MNRVLEGVHVVDLSANLNTNDSQLWWLHGRNAHS